jgi:hypothetical protein
MHHRGDGAAAVGEQLVERRGNVLGFQLRKTRQPGKIKKRI